MVMKKCLLIEILLWSLVGGQRWVGILQKKLQASVAKPLYPIFPHMESKYEFHTPVFR